MGEGQGSQDEGNQQGAGEGEQQGQQQQGEGDQGAGSGSLLDDEANGGGDDGGDGGDQQQQGTPDVAQIVADAVAAAVAEANRVADRRINQVLSRLEGQGQQGSGQQGGEGQGQQQQAPSGPDPIAVRAARMAAREYITTDLRFLGNEEREYAMSAASAAIAARPTIDDEDAVGREVATAVVTQVKSLRKFYEDRTKAALKKRGMLVDTGKGDQPSGGGGQQVAATSEFEKGKQVAAGLFPQQPQTQ